MKPVIEVNSLSKCYTINHKNKASYRTFKDDVSSFIKTPFSKRKSSEENFWALKNISFSVMPGEVFGIIGRNGSGKSTLLKMLSRIVDPTEGHIKIHGKAASLLEVGTGFHPELTGRENVFFNGSMIGMSRQEIQSKFNDIVAFSEVEKFIDTPVKFYSSGMYVRLAFAVAAHLQTDILILDEVLAVGDTAFQQKCLKKIVSSIKDGRTVLFVSHSMEAIKQICTKGILLEKGTIISEGKSKKIIDKYTEMNQLLSPRDVIPHVWKNTVARKYKHFTPHQIYLSDTKGKKIVNKINNNEDYWLTIEGTLDTESELFKLGYVLRTLDTKALLYMTLTTDSPKNKWPKLKKGKVKFTSKIPKRMLNQGQYQLSIIASIHKKEWALSPYGESPSIKFIIEGGLSDSPYWPVAREGVVAPLIPWSLEKSN